MRQKTVSRTPTIALATGMALLVALVSCSTNPATGRRQLIILSERDEISLGQQAAPGVQAEYGTYDDTRLVPLVDRVGKRLAATTLKPNLPYSFTLLDSPVVNAFALPGGPIYATRGLLAYANDEAELAGVLGHEVGHVMARHGAEQASRGQLMQVGMGVLAIAKPKIGQYGDLLGTGAGLLMLSFGRDAEREADKLGVRYLARADYDPFGLPRYMSVLDRLSQDRKQVLPGWLSTHPDPGERAKSTAALARPVFDQMKAAGKSPRVAAAEFMSLLDGLVYGNDPREGFQKGLTFHHPDLRFRFDLSEGWTTRNTRQFVAVLDNAQKPTAQLILRAAPSDEAGQLSPADYASKVASKNPQATLQGREQTINGLSAWLGQVSLKAQDGSTSEAIAAWIRHRELLYEFTGAWSQTATPETIAGLERAIRSFRNESDSSILGVKPVVLRLVDASQGQSLTDMCRSRRADLGAECAEIAKLNRLSPGAAMSRGTKIKVPQRQHPAYP